MKQMYSPKRMEEKNEAKKVEEGQRSLKQGGKESAEPDQELVLKQVIGH